MIFHYQLKLRRVFQRKYLNVTTLFLWISVHLDVSFHQTTLIMVDGNTQVMAYKENVNTLCFFSISHPDI